MHEASLMEDLMRRIHDEARGHNATRVTWLKVRLGPSDHLSPEHFRHHFQQAAAGTIAEHAELEIVEEPSAPDESVVLESLTLGV